jgi:hypothetical protein
VNIRNESSLRDRLHAAGRSAFAFLAVGAAVVALANGDSAASDQFAAGPLEDTWDYLVELWEMLMR